MMQHRRRMLMNVASALPPKDTLENTSWANIAIVAAAGKAAEYWAVGDTKTITFGAAVLGSTTITVTIMGFEYDDLADGSGKAPITFGMVDCFATQKALALSGRGNSTGWDRCDFRTTLINTVLPVFVDAIGDIIKPVSKRTGAGSKSSTIATVTDSIWLFSGYEAFGAATNAAAGEKPTDKSICYPAFTNNASRIKKTGSSASWWWLRSPYLSDGFSFLMVNSSGALANAQSQYMYGVAIGFCV